MGLSGKKLLLLGFIVVLMVIIPLTVYLVQQQQKLKVGAQQASSLSFAVTPGGSATISKPTDTASFDVMLDPSTNQVSFVKLAITYDITKLSVNAFTVNSTDFPTTLQQPDKGTTTGKATVTVSVGQDPNKIITGSPPRKVATISFNALSTATAGTTQLSFDRDPNTGTQVLSIGTSDQFNENVLANTPPTTITIAQSALAASPSPSASPSTSPSPTPAAGNTNKVPVCSGLAIDRQASGTVPYSLTFTASGTDSDGTITKVTFSFGDGALTDVTTGGGIGTSSVNTQISHTYNNAGTFQAKATLTDNQGGVSTDSCSQTITVTSGSAGTGGATGGTGTTQIVTVATPAPTALPGATALPGTKGGLPAPGPSDKIVSFGGLGVISVIIGALLLLGL